MAGGDLAHEYAVRLGTAISIVISLADLLDTMPQDRRTPFYRYMVDHADEFLRAENFPRRTEAAT